jgi:hypothetical protein
MAVCVRAALGCKNSIFKLQHGVEIMKHSCSVWCFCGGVQCNAADQQAMLLVHISTDPDHSACSNTGPN